MRARSLWLGTLALLSFGAPAFADYVNDFSSLDNITTNQGAPSYGPMGPPYLSYGGTAVSTDVPADATPGYMETGIYYQLVAYNVVPVPPAALPAFDCSGDNSITLTYRFDGPQGQTGQALGVWLRVYSGDYDAANSQYINIVRRGFWFPTTINGGWRALTRDFAYNYDERIYTPGAVWNPASIFMFRLDMVYWNAAFQPNTTTYGHLAIEHSEGACCFLDGTCQVMGPAQCREAAKGLYRGDGTTCDEVTCPAPAMLIAGNTDGNIRRVDTSIPGDSLLYSIPFGATGLAVDDTDGRLYASGGGGCWSWIKIFDLATGTDLTPGEWFDVSAAGYCDVYGLEFVHMPDGSGRLFSIGHGNPYRPFFIEYELRPDGLPSAIKDAFQLDVGGGTAGLAYMPGRDRFYTNHGNTFWEVDLNNGTSHGLFGLGLSGTNGLGYEEERLWGLSAGSAASLVYFDLDYMEQIQAANNGQVGNGWALSGSTTPTLVGRTGACCFPGHACQVMTERECALANGAYQGDYTTCDPNPCPVIGACCLPDGRCVIEAPAQCLADNGLYMGDDVPCDPNPCPEPTGACCSLNGDCVAETEAECLAAQGWYLGNGTTCDPNPCVANPPILISANADGSVRQINVSIPADRPLYNTGLGTTGMAVDDANARLYAAGGGGAWNLIKVFDLTTGADLTPGEGFSSEFTQLYGMEFVRVSGGGGGRLFSVGLGLDEKAHFIEYELRPDGLPSAVKSEFQILDGENQPGIMMGLAYVPERDRFYSNQSNNMFWEIDLNSRTSRPLFGLGMSATQGLGYEQGKLYGISAGYFPNLVYFNLDSEPHQVLVADNTQVANAYALSGSTSPIMPAKGACCFGTTCTITSQADCRGTYMGDGTVCFPDPCAPQDYWLDTATGIQGGTGTPAYWMYYPSGWINQWYPNEFDLARQTTVELAFTVQFAGPAPMVAFNYATTGWTDPNSPPVSDADIVRIPIDPPITAPGAYAFSTVLPFCPLWVSVDVMHMGGDFAIEGAIVHECLTPAAGACCLPRDPHDPVLPCAEAAESDCAAQGGVFMGAGTLCMPEPTACFGDADCTGEVDFDDISCFVAALAGGENGWKSCYRSRHCGSDPPCTFWNCDANGSGRCATPQAPEVDFDDISPFVAEIVRTKTCPPNP